MNSSIFVIIFVIFVIYRFFLILGKGFRVKIARRNFELKGFIVKIAGSNFEKKWNEYLSQKDLEKVVNLYKKGDISFLPTLSPDFVEDSEGVKKYFTHFLEKNPSGKITKEKIQVLSFGIFCPWRYCHSGDYNFEIGNDGQKQTVQARFTYVWELKWWNLKGWVILHHHSSVLPAK